MNNNDLLNRQIKLVLNKLTKTQKIFLYFRLLVRVVIYRIGQFAAQSLSSPRARIHWVGDRRRPVRPERHMITLLFLCAIVFLEPRDVAVWATIWGGATAMFVVLATVYMYVPRKRSC
jgi:hypothetical protein